MSVVLAVAVSGACVAEDDDPPQGEDESGSSGEAPSAEEQQAECQAAVEASNGLSCPPGAGILGHFGGDVPDLVVVPPEEVRIDLPHGFLIEGIEGALIGDVLVHNDHCFLGCIYYAQPGEDVCAAIDAEGNQVCGLIGKVDLESCETLTEACAGD